MMSLYNMIILYYDDEYCTVKTIDETYPRFIVRNIIIYSGLFSRHLVIVFLTLSVFWLPPESTEKFMLSGVTLVIVCILLMMISSNVPIMSDRIPLIGELRYVVVSEPRHRWNILYYEVPRATRKNTLNAVSNKSGY